VQNLQNWTAGSFQRNTGASLPSDGEFRLGIYFSTDKVMDRVHASVDRPGALGPPWTDGGTNRGGEGAAARSLEFGLWPLQCTKAHRQGRNRERSARGARLGPHWGSGGGVAIEQQWWHEEVTGNSAGRVSDAEEERRRAR
jgi:hypothetical protein